MLKAVGKFLLYLFVIFALVFSVALFGDKLQQLGQVIAGLFQKVQDNKPLASMEHWFKESLPEHSRDLRRKLMTLREETPPIKRLAKPTVLSSREKEKGETGLEKNFHERERVHSPATGSKDEITEKDRKDLDRFFDENLNHK